MEEESYIALSRYFKAPAFTGWDFASTLIIFVLVLLVAFGIKNKNSQNPTYKKYFISGLVIKMVGGLAYALVYTYYYTYGGDTSGYWRFGSQVARVMFDFPQYWWGVFTRDFNSSHSFVVGMLQSMSFARSMTEFRMVQITSLLAPFGLMNFYATTVLLAGITYTGVWRLFLLFREKYPGAEKGLAFSVLFVPSVVFWGSGLMKDTVVFSCVGLLVYAINKIFTRNKGWSLGNFTVLALAVFLIFSIKAYILFSLVPGLAMWRSFQFKERIRNRFIRSMALPALLAAAFIGSIYAIEFLGRYNPLYTLENFIAGAESMQNWHYQEGHNTSEQYGRGSSYTLGVYEPTPIGVLKKFPAAVNVTFFRPYPWEVNTVMQLLSAIESQLLLLFTVAVIWKAGLRRTLRFVNQDPFLLLMFSFSIIFAFGVGFSAYNFGALARYKVPAIPFFLGALMVVRHKVREDKKAVYRKYLESLRAAGGNYTTSET